MTLTDTQLLEVEEMAKCFFMPREIALVLQVPVAEFEEACKEEGTKVYQAYWKGWYTSTYEHRKKVITLANQGSSPAQTMVGKMIEDAKANLIKR